MSHKRRGFSCSTSTSGLSPRDTSDAFLPETHNNPDDSIRKYTGGILDNQDFKATYTFDVEGNLQLETVSYKGVLLGRNFREVLNNPNLYLDLGVKNNMVVHAFNVLLKRRKQVLFAVVHALIDDQVLVVVK